jgi:hypothetical protein
MKNNLQFKERYNMIVSDKLIYPEIYRILKSKVERIVVSHLFTNRKDIVYSINVVNWYGCINGAITKERHNESVYDSRLADLKEICEIYLETKCGDEKKIIAIRR